MDERLRGQGLGRRLVQAWMDPATCTLSFTTTPTDVSIHVMTGCGGSLLGSLNETVAHAWFVDGAHPQDDGATRHAVSTQAGFDDAFCQEYDALWQRIHPGHTLLLVRDARYLRWRYGAFPFATPTLLTSRDAQGQLSGLAVILAHARHDRLYVAELLTRRDDAAAQRGLLTAATDVARASGLKILFHATRDPRQVPQLAAAGFVPVPGEVPKFLGKLNRAPADQSVAVSDWSVSLGDGDQLYDIGETEH